MAPKQLLWLFPFTYAVHILEEGLAGERFYRWTRRVTGRILSAARFWILNGLLWIGMSAAVIVIGDRDEAAWLAATLGTVVAVNGFGHLVGSIASRSYSPGLVSGLLLWLPLGVFALVQTHGTARGWWLGIVTGLVIQAAVGGLALLLSRRR